jgi:hypothetical protein
MMPLAVTVRPEGITMLSLLDGWQLQLQMEFVVQLPLPTAVIVAPHACAGTRDAQVMAITI